MGVPVLLIVGFLGAGKTTVVNHLLAHAGGRRIAAVVNDFGSVDIDAELITGAEGGVVSLSNGCICCTLEGELLRTLSKLLRHDPRPEAIVIETSGVADPTDIVRNLMDPVVFREAPLETVLCVVDGTAVDAAFEPLALAQIRAADVIALSKLDLTQSGQSEHAREAIARINPRAAIVEAINGEVPMAVLFPPTPDEPVHPRPLSDERPVRTHFETTTWTADRPVSLSLFQAAIERLAPRLARAKGFFETIEQPGRQFLLQLAGTRANVTPAGTPPPDRPCVRIVFIAAAGALTPAEIHRTMNGSRSFR